MAHLSAFPVDTITLQKELILGYMETRKPMTLRQLASRVGCSVSAARKVLRIGPERVESHKDTSGAWMVAPSREILVETILALSGRSP